MSEVTTSLPTKLPRIDLTCENNEDIQFVGKIARHKDGYITQTMEELIRDVYYDVYPQSGQPAILGVISVSSDYIDLPEDPMIEVVIETLRGTALDYAVAEALEWIAPRAEGGKLTFTSGAVYEDKSYGEKFAPSCSDSITSYFINKHQLSVTWVPIDRGNEAGKKVPLIGVREQSTHHGATGDTLPEAVARYIVKSATPRPYVSIPYSLLGHIDAE
jgi:hypothetical protein